MDILRTFKQTELCYLSNSGDRGFFNNEKRLKIGARLVSRNNYKRRSAHADVKKEEKMGVLKVFKDHRKVERSTRASHRRISKIQTEMAELRGKIKFLTELATSQSQVTVKPLSKIKNDSKNDSSYESREINKIKKSKRMVIRNKMVQNNHLATGELERLIVNSEKLCSSSTFYRHLRTLINEGVRVVSDKSQSEFSDYK